MTGALWFVLVYVQPHARPLFENGGSSLGISLPCLYLGYQHVISSTRDLPKLNQITRVGPKA